MLNLSLGHLCVNYPRSQRNNYDSTEVSVETLSKAAYSSLTGDWTRVM